MSASNVRNIDSLRAFHDVLVRYANDGDLTLQELRMLIGRAEEYFSQSRPAYWRKQLRLAERELTEAQDSLSQKQAATRTQDRPSASEAVKRVRVAQQRVSNCQEKVRAARTIAIEISRQCDGVLGPLAEVTEQCQVVLPGAAAQLRTIIDHLLAYTDQTDQE